MDIQPILNIAEICNQKGITNVVISPGSRSAPITLGFANHSNINCKIVNDERSAAFIAIGMALQLNKTVALVCTSGTAALNYAPAIAEAYYQQIPLLVLTADRPPELIDQQDGQCLRQFEIFKNYVKTSYQTPDTLSSVSECKTFYTVIDSALKDVNSSPFGPIHINIPIREPFYPNNKVVYELLNFENSHVINKKKTVNFSEIINKINSTNKVLFIAGQQRYNKTLNNQIEKISNDLNYPVITDINSNLTNVNSSIQTEELIFQKPLKDIHPEMVITFGNSILSKKLKTYFREHKIIHYHLAETNPIPDFFFQLTKGYSCKPIDFFDNAIENIKKGNEDYYNSWKEIDYKIKNKSSKLLNDSEYSEPYILKKILDQLPESSTIHLANSMAVRWVNIIGTDSQKKFQIQSNRGVSGIDGSTSTALGYAINSSNSNFLITGDIAFFYDRNAFWNNYIPRNFKIILLNNHEGGIFNMIPGPNNNKETLSYFTSSQNLTASYLAKEFEISYFLVTHKVELEEQLPLFLNSKTCSVLELKTDSSVNRIVLDKLKNLTI